MIDAKRIEEMKRLLAKATLGPWGYDKGCKERMDRRPAVIEHFDYGHGEWFIHGDIANIEDAQFIAESRRFVPDIIDAYEEVKVDTDAYGIVVRGLNAMVAERDIEIAKLRKALEYYANGEIYEYEVLSIDEDGTEHCEEPPVIWDGGRRAREALQNE